MLSLYIYDKIDLLVFVAYSYSCGYRKAFEQYVNILKEKYPELQVEGENFDPPGYNMFIAKVLVSMCHCSQ